MDIIPYIAADQIAERVRALGRRITQDYQGEQLHLVVLLHGALIFAADLMRAIELPVTVDIVRFASYEGTQSTGKVRHLTSLESSLTGRKVLILDDILDTGLTLESAVGHAAACGADDVRTCVLLDKPSRRINGWQADYRGFAIDNHFVVGYGLDYEGRYRNLPFIGRLSEAVASLDNHPDAETPGGSEAAG